MKILFEHAEKFSYRYESNSKELNNVLVARISVEKEDWSKMNEIAPDIVNVFNTLKPAELVIFPFSHLSNNLMESQSAKQFLQQLTQQLSEKIPALMLPYGIAKGYSIIVKTHPLNNIFRNY